MKIAKFTPLFLLFLTNNLSAQLYNTKEADPVNIEKNEKIRSKNKISESFEFIRQANSNDSILKSHQTYNKDGELLTNVVFSIKKDTLNYAAYEYMGNKLVKSHMYSKNKNILAFNDISRFFYDKEGNNIAIEKVNKEGKTIYQKIAYNKNNLKTVLNTKWLNQKDFSITEECFYSKDNNLIKKKTYWPNGKLFSKIEYEYDNIGNLIGYNRFQDGKKDITSFYSYDKDNELIESGFEFLFGKKPNLYKTKYEYDANNIIIKKHHIVDNVLKTIHTITYKKFE